jgi:hypothetical protein
VAQENYYYRECRSPRHFRANNPHEESLMKNLLTIWNAHASDKLSQEGRRVEDSNRVELNKLNSNRVELVEDSNRVELNKRIYLRVL